MTEPRMVQPVFLFPGSCLGSLGRLVVGGEAGGWGAGVVVVVQGASFSSLPPSQQLGEASQVNSSS